MDQIPNPKCESECVGRKEQTAQQVVHMGEIEHIKCEPELFEDEPPVTEHEAQFPFVKCESEWSLESKEEIDDGEVCTDANHS
ncbi:uncharacterized protein [Anabrus simplex]|uniref:uncharacterized protein isoform X2 n=1 Tax=Anabrus simplex TaxID=316456 RepID=UPI0035A36879